ncbi:hypothetical protein FJY68_02660 [candidate division WOR-3 bacterium]|uniref:T9SS type A sorting domain-containing protein n=1 Tax=candidate division WOR-3 bacterium TaxID=2052148 RepID=A0A937XC83_UNCW3|nr:hypothetical protein [candidate division WOR-3 bacterium]
MARIGPAGLLGPILLSALATAGGAEVTWDTIIRLTTNPSSQVTGYTGQRSVAVDGAGSVHVAWQDQRAPMPYKVWYRRYDPDSGSWLAETTLSTPSANCFQPSIACDSTGNVHVVWHIGSAMGTGIWAKRYNAGTRHWRADTLIDSTSTSNPQLYPSVACVPGTGDAAVAWYGLPDTGMFYQVFLKERHPATGWDSAMQVSSAATSHDQVSVAAGANGEIAVVWVGRDFGGDYNQVYCRRRVVGAWQGVELVSDIPLALSQYAPSVAFDPEGAVHAVWYGRTLNSGYFQVFHRMHGDGGWSNIDTISGTRPYQQQHPSIACDAMGRCHAVWCSQAGGSNFQLAYNQRDTNGVWSSAMILTGLDSGSVSHPSVACHADSGIHVVWYDASSGNQDVYYLRGTLPGPGVAEPRPAPFVLRPVTVATFVRGILYHNESTSPSSLMDVGGRKVMDLVPGANDVHSLAPGVYFLCASDGGQYCRLVLIR